MKISYTDKIYAIVAKHIKLITVITILFSREKRMWVENVDKKGLIKEEKTGKKPYMNPKE